MTMSDEAKAAPRPADAWTADCAQVLACPGGVELLLGRRVSAAPDGGDLTARLEARLRLDDALARELFVQLRRTLAADGR